MNNKELTGASRAWALIAMGDGQQYAGDQGYADDPRRVYNYDSKSRKSQKPARWGPGFYQRPSAADRYCDNPVHHLKGWQEADEALPVCGTVDLKGRKTVSPTYRCDKDHEFDEPLEQLTDVTQFEAHYADTFPGGCGRCFCCAAQNAQLKLLPEYADLEDVET